MEVKDMTKILGKMDTQKAAKITSQIRQVEPNRLKQKSDSKPSQDSSSQDSTQAGDLQENEVSQELDQEPTQDTQDSITNENPTNESSIKDSSTNENPADKEQNTESQAQNKR